MTSNDASFLVLFLAPVKEYLADDQVSEILINGPDRIYIERGGKLQETDAAFASEAQLKAAAVNIAKSVERQLDDMHPDLDARLPDGSRVHATIPPISRCGKAGARIPSCISQHAYIGWRTSPRGRLRTSQGASTSRNHSPSRRSKPTPKRLTADTGFVTMRHDDQIFESIGRVLSFFLKNKDDSACIPHMSVVFYNENRSKGDGEMDPARLMHCET